MVLKITYLIVEAKIIIPEYNPVHMRESFTRPRASANGRPLPRVMTTRYEYKVKVKKTDWSHPSMNLNNLLNDKLPFETTVFTISEVMQQ